VYAYDLFKQFKDEYKQPKKPVLIETTPANYLMILGQGAPGGDAFQEAVGALYSMAFTIKMTRKGAGLGDYVVCKLEATWWVGDGNDFAQFPQEQWEWKMMIRTPDCVTQADLEKAQKAVIAKGKGDEVLRVKLEMINEGRCVQMLHVGPYDREGETVAIMQTFVQENALSVNGRHHEIYLSDPRRVPPERLKTILRIPVS
jgi:hypothetical protein